MEQIDFYNIASLLWPTEKSRESCEKKVSLSDDSFRDIGLEEIINQFSVTEAYRSFIKTVFSYMCEDPEVINYRLDIMEDIVNNSDIENCLLNVFSIACEIERCSIPEKIDSPHITNLVKSFKQTDLYGSALSKTRTCLMNAENKIKAKGLRRLKDTILMLSEKFAYEEDTSLAEQSEDFVKPASITLGINLDMNLRPMESTIVSVNDYKYTKASFLTKLTESKSIYDFHPNDEGGLKSSVIQNMEKASEAVIKIDSTALQLSLLSDLDRIMKNSINALKTVIHRYNNTYSDFFLNLKYELLFFLSAVKMIKRLNSAGMKMIRPVAYPKDMRICKLKGLYNINLIFKSHINRPSMIVKNDIEFSGHGNIFILTGPNSGGKTTYINALSLIQVLFQAGMYVPADNAALSPVDNIYTHFSSEEKRDTDYGRLGEEAKRLNHIFRNATEYSFVVLNESLASTSPGECLLMSKDIICGLKLLNARTVFATHQHELALAINDINNSFKGNGVIKSLVAGAEKKEPLSSKDCFQRTYKVTEAPPQGLSYAKDIAESFGISYEQIQRTLNSRLMI